MGAHCSNCLVSFLNTITLIIGMYTMFLGVRASENLDFACNRIAYEPLVAFGAVLSLMSLFGLFGTCCRATFCMWLYLLILFLVIVMIAFGTAFGTAVMRKAPDLHGTTYYLKDFSTWMQDNVVGAAEWPRIHTCLAESNFCANVLEYPFEETSVVERGCCLPPSSCGYEPPDPKTNNTHWRIPKTGLASTAGDCRIWNEKDLCFDCECCKAGILANIKHTWIGLSVIYLWALAILTIVFCLGCHAFRTNRRRYYHLQHNGQL
ncbi:hypothetical protein Droror1_Dr00016177 [Drosera rotundifolia]